MTSYLPRLCRYQRPRGLRRSAAACLLRSWVRILPGSWMFVCCECCALSGRGLCDELITRPEESYRLCCVVVCDLETSRMRRLLPALSRSATKKRTYHFYNYSFFLLFIVWRKRLIFRNLVFLPFLFIQVLYVVLSLSCFVISLARLSNLYLITRIVISYG